MSPLGPNLLAFCPHAGANAFETYTVLLLREVHAKENPDGHYFTDFNILSKLK
jgi:hypothetical protein